MGSISVIIDLVANCDLMWKQSVWSSVLASQIGARHLNRYCSLWSGALEILFCCGSGGLLVLTGANAALNATPGKDNHTELVRDTLLPYNYVGMLGYGMAKAAVHQLVQSLRSCDGGLPADCTVLGILP